MLTNYDLEATGIKMKKRARIQQTEISGIWEKPNSPGGPGARTQGESNPGQKGLRDRNSPTCTLSQNGYGEGLILRFGCPKQLQKGCGRGGKEPNLQKSRNVDSVCSFIPCIPISLPCACSFRFPDLHH